MADNTIIQQGDFVSTGVAKTLVLRSDVDWIRTYNLTTIAASTQWDSTEHYWQKEMAVGDGLIWFHAAATQALSMTTSVTGFNSVATRPGFYPINSSTSQLGAAVAVTAGTNATTPVYSTADTGAVAVGSIVRVVSTAHTNLNGLDFTVSAVTADTSITLGNTLATAPGVVAGANGYWRYVAPDLATYKLFYPSNRVVSNITAANPAVVTTLVDHGFTSGQTIRMKVPAANGMIQLDDLTATVTYVSAATFSINIDTSGFTAFNFPLPAAVPYTNAEVIPVGQTPSATGIMGGATTNVGYLGITLGSAGAVSGTPTGVADDVIKWVAGKSFADNL